MLYMADELLLPAAGSSSWLTALHHMMPYCSDDNEMAKTQQLHRGRNACC